MDGIAHTDVDFRELSKKVVKFLSAAEAELACTKVWISLSNGDLVVEARYGGRWARRTIRREDAEFAKFDRIRVMLYEVRRSLRRGYNASGELPIRQKG